MPKKTRKEKILSAERKKTRLLQQISQPITPVVISSSPKIQKPVLDETETGMKTFFIKDLKKSLLLVGLIIALEIIIYFGTINNYFRF